MDFTLKAYEGILQAIKAVDLPVYTVEKWLRSPGMRGVIMRHDVDRLPGNALEMAKLEAKYNINSTYYFRIGKHTFKPKIIRAIAEMGHEIGYHYEDLSLADGNFEEGYRLFKFHLEALRKYAVVETIAMHGRPLSKYDNRDLWKRFDYQEEGIIGEAFLSIDYSDIYYFTDTGRSWAETSVNLRDKVFVAQTMNLDTSKELSAFIKSNFQAKISIVAHPERWNSNWMKWMGYFGFDLMINLIKRSLLLIRK